LYPLTFAKGVDSIIDLQNYNFVDNSTPFQFYCEQLNALLGGFESISKRITPGNFNWFLHSMLSYHPRYVLEKQKQKVNKEIVCKLLGFIKYITTFIYSLCSLLSFNLI